MPPRMIVVAGPPGGGKSSIFPLAMLGTKYFNADDRAAELNAGSYRASERTLRRIYDASLANLLRAFAEMDDLWIYDNSKFGAPPTLLFEGGKGAIRFQIDAPPIWLNAALPLT